jgi:hypothetical protein
MLGFMGINKYMTVWVVLTHSKLKQDELLHCWTYLETANRQQSLTVDSLVKKLIYSRECHWIDLMFLGKAWYAYK